ncbi:hypothetical protein [Desulfosarcina ovata]|nr:hypothetical protein [Desulfosarcina ovata]
MLGPAGDNNFVGICLHPGAGQPVASSVEMMDKALLALVVEEGAEFRGSRQLRQGAGQVPAGHTGKGQIPGEAYGAAAGPGQIRQVLHELISGRRGLFGMGGCSRERGRVAAVAVVTGIMFGLATWCYVLSMGKAGAVSASIAIQTYPLFAILVEMVLIRQGKSFLQLALTLGLVLDLYYLGTGGTWRLAGISVWFLAALGVPLLWSIAHVLIREELTTTPITPAKVTFPGSQVRFVASNKENLF